MKTLQLLPLSLIGLLFVFQACVNNKISSEKAANKKSVIVVTHDGYTYDLPWYEVKEGKLISILNTSRIVQNKEQILEVAIDNPTPIKVGLIDALSHDGEISVIAFDEGQRVHHYKFYELKKIRAQYIGYTFTGDYAANITIPLENVKKIEVDKVQHMDETMKRILGWTFIIGLQCYLIYNGHADYIWLY